MTCLDCKHCDVKGQIDYYRSINGVCVRLKCDVHGRTLLIYTDSDKENCCEDFEAGEDESS